VKTLEIKTKEYPRRILILEKVLGIPKERLMKESPIEIRKLWIEHKKAIEDVLKDKKIEIQANADYQDPPTVDQLKNAISLMYGYAGRMFHSFTYSGQTYAVMKEYPAYPVAIYIRNIDKTHWMGWWGNDRGNAYTKIYWVSKGYDYVLMDVGFEDMDREANETPDYDYNEPFLWMDRYFTDTQIEYEITPKQLDTIRTIDVFLNGYDLWVPITSNDLNTTKSITVNYTASLRAWRYAVRHGVRLGYYIFYIFGNASACQALERTWNTFGFTKDIYDPIFGASAGYDLLYLFDAPTVFHDCDVWGSLPRGKYLGYPYWSRVCYDRNTYTALFMCSDLGNLLYAIHALVKGYGIDTPIVDACNTFVGGIPSTTTVRNIINALLQYYYTSCGMVYTTDTSKTIISGLRTNLALILFTLVAYKLGYREYAQYADNLADRVYNAVIKNAIITLADGSQIKRPQHIGGEMVSWKCLSPQQGFAEISESWIEAVASQMLGWQKMPPEDSDYGVTNNETTLTGLQALRVYLRYKYGETYPSTSYYP
jgi:hypothetical protein